MYKIDKMVIVIVMLGLLLTGCSTHAELEVQRENNTGVYKTKSRPAPKPRYVRPALPDLRYDYVECGYKNKTIEVFIENNKGRGLFYACENYEVVRAGYLSSGDPKRHKTPRGNYKVQWKAKEYDSKKYPSTNGGRNMDNAMFYSGGFAVHAGNINGLSHGCVRTQRYQSEWLYDWAPHGTKIVIRDL